MNALHNTIAAIASGAGGGIGVVRISGPQAAAIAQRICRPWPAEVVSHRLYLGQAYAPRPDVHAPSPLTVPSRANGEPTAGTDGRPIDQVMFCLMRGPHSYTGDDVVELHGHGGALNLRRLLDACLAAGAHAAGPGEFTRRAFLAGKLDLTRAEAVAALIHAHSQQALQQAQRQLSGELGQVVAELRRKTIDLLGEFEGMLDFPDAEADPQIEQSSRPTLQGLRSRVQGLADSFSEGGRALSNGIEIAVIGRPNVGKSSLINALCGGERVIVDAQPGTTRDYVEVRCDFQGVPVTLIDTAGERQEATSLEIQGLRLGRERWARADLLLFVLDSNSGLSDDEAHLLASLPSDRPRLIAWNKIDRVGSPPPPTELSAIGCSALCGWGLDALRRQVLARLAPRLDRDDEVLVTSARQAALLSQAGAALSAAENALAAGEPTELIAGELRVAAVRLGELTGAEVSDGVLDAIFARFCVGK